MRIKIIKVPTGETFYFCKQFMFHLAGTEAATFVAKFDDKGYTGYPYHPDGNTSMLFTFITAKNKAETVKIINETQEVYERIIIITDQNNLGFTVAELIDITDPREYYNTGLDLDKLYIKLLT